MNRVTVAMGIPEDKSSKVMYKERSISHLQYICHPRYIEPKV